MAKKVDFTKYELKIYTTQLNAKWFQRKMMRANNPAQVLETVLTK